MKKDSKIYITGHQGMVGSSIYQVLISKGYKNIVVRTSRELDLRNQADVEYFFEQENPEYVFHAAARVGGVAFNAIYSADILYDNMMIDFNVISSAYKFEVKKLINFNSALIYKDSLPVPYIEKSLNSFEINENHTGYNLSKLSSLSLVRFMNLKHNMNYVNLICSNIYGPNDKYDGQRSNVVAALILKFKKALDDEQNYVDLFGDGSQVRDFIYSEDVAIAAIKIMTSNNIKYSEINVSSSIPTSIRELALMISQKIGFKGEIIFNSSFPGKNIILLDNSRIKSLGWEQIVSLNEGLSICTESYVRELNKI